MSAQRRKEKDRRKKRAKAQRRAARAQDAEAIEEIEASKPVDVLAAAVEGLALTPTLLTVRLKPEHGSLKADALDRDRIYLSKQDWVSKR